MTILLEIVQDLLSSTSGEEVNSIFDTVESEQYARAVKDCYEVLLATMDLPEREGLFELNASGDSSKPTLMKMPSTAESLFWIRYDSKKDEDTHSDVKEIEYLPLDDFLTMTYSFDMDESNVSSYNLNINNAIVEIRFKNDVAPSYYTTTDESTILFDSFDSGTDSTLQKSKTLCFGKLTYDFSMDDNFEIPLSKDRVILLKQEAKTQVFSEFKQVDNALSSKKARELKLVSQKNKKRIATNSGVYLYGRHSFKE